MEVYSREKEVLLDSVNEVLFHKDENITISLVISVIMVVMVVLFLFVPKIYLSNNIYKISVSIENLRSSYFSLKNENEILNKKIAKIKYKNGVTH
jgi:cell division protein FtsB